MNLFNDDFQEFIRALNESNVEYILIGGYSVILYGYQRTTGDMDLWVNPTPDNYVKLRKAFLDFGIPINLVSKEMFLNTRDFEVFTFGRPPVQIDILTVVKGMDFTSAHENSKWFHLEGQLDIKVIDREDLIQIKRAAGRYRDLDDIQQLLSEKEEE